MKIIQKTAAVLFAASICSAPLTVNAANLPAEQSKDEAAISADQAKKIALKEIPGQITKIALKKDEDGVLVYKIKILKDGQEFKIKIDAQTGKLLKMKNKD
ncbi:PepSY domain-containing protein [Metabacillus sp. GX 13764]|uniref:PepSY domain-containing protein n=1 Tax=Metabacillus kandeliae TaxID=2900151 RepID=UPI001E5F44F7|nr:PepSY domain-containing protein [Metabacillus kandeliae]MCD7035413.1 PepSY domain-containing protein [Metabacillus kandeliae]